MNCARPALEPIITDVQKRVLLADDSTTIRRLVELSFAGDDVSVTSVGDGDQAVEAIRNSPPDLVLADIGMPGRTGYEVAEFVRSQPDLVSMPVLLLAGAFDAVDQEKARRVGADGILTKPFDPHVLVGRVQELLATGRGAQTLIASTRVTAPSLRAAGIAGEAPAVTPPPAVREQVPAPGTMLPSAPPVSHDPADTSPAAHRAPASSSSDTERYFDELDQAFAALSRSPRPLSPLPRRDDVKVETDPVGTVPPPPAPPASRTVLTDAFAALLEAEQSGSGVSLPMPLPMPAPAPAIDVNALADQIARRVLEQLTDRVVRETVAEIVAATAERLVREEIEQIKSNIT